MTIRKFKSFQLSIILQNIFLFVILIGFLGKFSPHDFSLLYAYDYNISLISLFILACSIIIFLFFKKKSFLEKLFYTSPWICLFLSFLTITFNPSITWYVIPMLFFIQWCIVLFSFLLENKWKFFGGLLSIFFSTISFIFLLDYIYFNTTSNHIRLAHLFPIVIGLSEHWNLSLVLYVIGITVGQAISIIVISFSFLAFPFVLAFFFDKAINNFGQNTKKSLFIFSTTLLLVIFYNTFVTFLPLPDCILWYMSTRIFSISDIPVFSAVIPSETFHSRTIKIDKSNLEDKATYSWINDEKERKNIVFLTIESWRRDAIDKMPFVKSLSEKGLYFSNHYTPSNDSLGGTTAFFYSIFPPYISQTNQEYKKLNADELINVPAYIRLDKFAAFLKPSNFISFLQNSNFKLIRVLDSITLEYPKYFAKSSKEAEKELNLPQQEFDGGYTQRSLDIILEYLKQPGFKIMETVLYDTHYNYTYPQEFEIYKPVVKYRSKVFISFSKENIVGMRNRYYNSANYVDEMLKRFFSKLQKEGLDKDSIFIILGDHGECIGEDGSFFHASGSHENQFKTIAIIIGPNIPAIKIENITTHEDIIPTLSNFAGYASQNTFGLNALKTKRDFIISYDITKDQNIIIRHKDYMNIFEIMEDGSLKWKSLTRNDYSLDSGIFELLCDENETLSSIINKDRKLIVDYFNKKIYHK